MLNLRGDRRPFALVGEWLGVDAILGSEPVSVAELGSDPFGVLGAHPGVTLGEARVGGGWVGWLGYGLGARLERLPPPPPARTPRDPFSLALYDHVVVRCDGCWWFEALWQPGREAELRERIELWRTRMSAPPRPPRPVPLTPFTPVAGGEDGHVAAVAECCSRIAAGELSQANLCLRLEAECSGDPLDLFARALPAASPGSARWSTAW